MSEPIAVAWPPSSEQRQLISQLGLLIRAFGAERFAGTALIRADQRDFPERWEPTLFGVHRLFHRLCWLAYCDPEVIVDDQRPPTPPVYKMLTSSAIELTSVQGGRVTLEVAAIGNDDVAGLLAGAVGAAFLALAPTQPFRSTTREPTAADSAVAAIYLGLGVLVANAAMYRRHASRIVGKQVVSEQYIEKVGGLTIVDATFLLAVQDVVRDDFQDALATLHPPQREWVERWVAVLEPHEDELRAWLELDSCEPCELARPGAPRVPVRVAEPNLAQFNRGRTTFRVPARRRGRALLGMLAGALGFALPVWFIAGPLGMVVGAFAGHHLAGRVFECADPECGVVMATELPTCPRCGGTIADTIAHARLRLDRLEELELESGGDEPT